MLCMLCNIWQHACCACTGQKAVLNVSLPVGGMCSLAGCATSIPSRGGAAHLQHPFTPLRREPASRPHAPCWSLSVSARAGLSEYHVPRQLGRGVDAAPALAAAPARCAAHAPTDQPPTCPSAMLLLADCDGGNLTRNLMAGRVTWYRRGKKVRGQASKVGWRSAADRVQ